MATTNHWEVWTFHAGNTTKRQHDGFGERSARRVFQIWKEDMDTAVKVQLLLNGDLVDEYSVVPLSRGETL